MSSGGISIVRISGENAISVADTIFEAKIIKSYQKQTATQFTMA